MTDSNETPDDVARRIATAVRDQLNEADPSRRGFLGKTAIAGGSLLALGTGVGAASSDHGDEGDGGSSAAFDDTEGTDLDVLNYALTLEHLEDALYQQGIEMFDEGDFADSSTLEDAPEGQVAEVYEYVQTAGEQESIHVETLSKAVSFLGGEPVEPAEYSFGVDSVDTFLATAAAIENVGVSAYAGAAPFVESPDLLGVALAIHSVEARHAAVLNNVVGEPPFPNAFDPARSQEEVLEAAGPFFASSAEESDDGDGGDGDNSSAQSLI